MSDRTQSFDALMAAVEPSNHEAGKGADARLEVSPEWAQGRSLYGGLVGALLARCASKVAPPDRALRSVLIQFVGPSEPGMIGLSARVLRSGKSVTQIEAKLTQGGATCSAALLAYAADRTSVAVVPPEEPPEVDAPERYADLPYIAGVMPRFLQNFTQRWALGALPYSSDKRAELGGWCRFRDIQGALQSEHVLALADAWPPALLPMLHQPAPASTITWSLDFVAPLEGTVDQWWLYHARTLAASGGHGHTEAKLWNADGELIATSRQFVAVFG